MFWRGGSVLGRWVAFPELVERSLALIPTPPLFFNESVDLFP